MDITNKEDKDVSIWEAAQRNNVVFSRKATQMEARYKRVLKKNGGFKEAMKLFSNGVDDEMWLNFFKPKEAKVQSNHQDAIPLLVDI